MSNHSWACFTCRTTVRRPSPSKDVRCRQCGQQSEYLGTKIPIPAKSKLKEWKALEASYYAGRRTFELRRLARAVRTKHDIEQEISRLSALPDSEGRATAIKLLQKRLGAAHG
jgi:hypothetical protein